MIYTAHFSAIHIKNPNLSQQVDIIKKFTFLKKYIPFSCSNEVKKNASTPFFSFFFHIAYYLKKKTWIHQPIPATATQNPVSFPPINNVKHIPHKTKNINSTQIETKKKLTEKHPKEKKFNPTLFRESLFFPNTT